MVVPLKAKPPYSMAIDLLYPENPATSMSTEVPPKFTLVLEKPLWLDPETGEGLHKGAFPPPAALFTIDTGNYLFHNQLYPAERRVLGY
jgi:hypothetical protein